ncbi:MAG TPA: DUF2092 domain-containing protein [Kofleriaceae bacterium]
MFGFAATSGAQPTTDTADKDPAEQGTTSKDTVNKEGAKQKTAKNDTAKKSAKPPAIDPNALAALDKMGAYLRDQQSFTVRTKTETDYVLDDGQKVRMASSGELRAKRPDHLRVDVVSDRKERRFYYDGKTFTMFSPRIGYYSTVAAPPTIGELADQLEERFGLTLPMVDLFRWGSDKAAIDQIKTASHVGTAKIGGVDTDHWAFRQPGLDWQIWIERGDKPVPRKLLLTTTDDAARPEHSIEMTWDLSAKHDDSVFAFAAPKNAHEIAQAEIVPEVPASRSARRTKR